MSSAPGRDIFDSLTGLRLVLAVWIAGYHLVAFFGGGASLAEHPLVKMGAARVDVFFVLSGFVLAHIYAVRTGGRFDFGPFMVARVARLYPLHLTALAMLGVLVGAAYLVGQAEEAQRYTLSGLVANLLMLQAWNIPGAGQWNFPAWTLSAEFFAYLCFPVFVAVAARLAGRPWLLLLGALGLVALVEAVWPILGHGPLQGATQTFGVVRGAAGVVIGIAARYAFEAFPNQGRAALAATGLGAVVAGGAAILEAPLTVLHVGAAALLIGLAGLDRARVRTPLSAPAMVSAASCSYALFVLHVPVFAIGAQTLRFLGWDGALGILSGAALMGAAILVAVMANRVIEEPSRIAIRDRAGVKRPRPAETP